MVINVQCHSEQRVFKNFQEFRNSSLYKEYDQFFFQETIECPTDVKPSTFLARYIAGIRPGKDLAWETLETQHGSTIHIYTQILPNHFFVPIIRTFRKTHLVVESRFYGHKGGFCFSGLNLSDDAQISDSIDDFNASRGLSLSERNCKVVELSHGRKLHLFELYYPLRTPLSALRALTGDTENFALVDLEQTPELTQQSATIFRELPNYVTENKSSFWGIAAAVLVAGLSLRYLST